MLLFYPIDWTLKAHAPHSQPFPPVEVLSTAASSPPGERATTTTKQNRPIFSVSISCLSDRKPLIQTPQHRHRRGTPELPETVALPQWALRTHVLNIDHSKRKRRARLKQKAAEEAKRKLAKMVPKKREKLRQKLSKVRGRVYHIVFTGDFKFLKNTEVDLIYNVVLISGVQQRNSVIRVCVCVVNILFHSFPLGVLLKY